MTIFRKLQLSIFLISLFVFKIKSQSFVSKILIEDKVAKGVEFDDPTIPVNTVKATKEVLICGGAINSPLLLMLSGIGPKDHLDDVQIECIQDLPVGENLKDQLIVPISFSVKSKKFSLDYFFGSAVQVIFLRSLLFNYEVFTLFPFLHSLQKQYFNIIYKIKVNCIHQLLKLLH